MLSSCMRRSAKGNHSVLTHLSWSNLLLRHPTPAVLGIRSFLACSKYFLFSSLSFTKSHVTSLRRHLNLTLPHRAIADKQNGKRPCFISMQIYTTEVHIWEATGPAAALYILHQLHPLLRTRVVQGHAKRPFQRQSPRTAGCRISP